MSGELASVTIVIGDSNANGETDVSLQARVFGASLPAIVLDLPTLDARAIGAALFNLAGKPKEERTKHVRDMLDRLRERSTSTPAAPARR